MNYAFLIEKMNILTEDFCDSSMRCPDFEKKYIRFYRVAKILTPNLFRLTSSGKSSAVEENQDLISREVSNSAEILLGQEVPKTIEDYFMRVWKAHKKYLNQKNL